MALLGNGVMEVLGALQTGPVDNLMAVVISIGHTSLGELLVNGMTIETTMDTVP